MALQLEAHHLSHTAAAKTVADKLLRYPLKKGQKMNFYDKLYDTNGINYGCVESINKLVTEREQILLSEIKGVLEKCGIAEGKKVLEVGASVGNNHQCHPNYLGIEYSSVAVEQGKKRFGETLNVVQGDATELDLESNSVDFLFTFATLEHIPEIEKALSEIERVLKKEAIAYLSPAWNCRIWTVEKLECIPDSELSASKFLQKKLIPIRESLIYRFIKAVPIRLFDEFRLMFSPIYFLRCKDLPVNFDLIEKYGHVADDDAFVNVDSHSAMCWYRSRGFKILSHPSLIQRLLCRGEAILIQKT